MAMYDWLPDFGIEPYYADRLRAIYLADSRELLAKVSGIGSAVVTDPPYNLTAHKKGGSGLASLNLNSPAGRSRITTGFMGKAWDGTGVSFQKETWEVIRQACKPGAMLLSFGGCRTFHRIAVAIEDAGYELRDTIMWVFATGMVKGLDISRAIDKAAGVERPVVGRYQLPNGQGWSLKQADDPDVEHVRGGFTASGVRTLAVTAPVSVESRLWSGYNSAIKPAYEPILLCMNPLDQGFVRNALTHKVAGLNIDECRVPVTEDGGRPLREVHALRDTVEYHPNSLAGRVDGSLQSSKAVGSTALGRFPSNLILDGSDEVIALFPQSKGQQGDVKGTEPSHTGDENTNCYGEYGRVASPKRGDNGSAARFFYCSKSSRSERNSGGDNNHPTVKPLALCEYLVKLVKMPEYNLILDPFCGSGTTLLACGNLGIHSIGIDSDEDSCRIAAARCTADVIDKMRKGVY